MKWLILFRTFACKIFRREFRELTRNDSPNPVPRPPHKRASHRTISGNSRHRNGALAFAAKIGAVAKVLLLLLGFDFQLFRYMEDAELLKWSKEGRSYTPINSHWVDTDTVTVKHRWSLNEYEIPNGIEILTQLEREGKVKTLGVYHSPERLEYGRPH